MGLIVCGLLAPIWGADDINTHTHTRNQRNTETDAENDDADDNDYEFTLQIRQQVKERTNKTSKISCYRCCYFPIHVHITVKICLLKSKCGKKSAAILSALPPKDNKGSAGDFSSTAFQLTSIVMKGDKKRIATKRRHFLLSFQWMMCRIHDRQLNVK